MELDHCDRKCASNASLQWLIAVAVPVMANERQNSISRHTSPSFSAVPPSPAKRVCATQAGERVGLQLGHI